jgi:hypothetical protein
LSTIIRKKEIKSPFLAGRWSLSPVILASQEAEIRRIVGLKPVWTNSLRDPTLKKTLYKKKGLTEWLKVKALSSNPSTVKESVFLKL